MTFFITLITHYSPYSFFPESRRYWLLTQAAAVAGAGAPGTTRTVWLTCTKSSAGPG